MAVSDFIRRALSRLTPQASIEKKLDVKIATSDVMDNAIELWSHMYDNSPPWRGGPANVIPLNLPASHIRGNGPSRHDRV